IDGGQPIDLIRDSGRLFRCEPYRGGCSSSWFLVPSSLFLVPFVVVGIEQGTRNKGQGTENG
ncbi:MAG: hypothetical protein V2A73_22550, partial [Pseudomonadota bacterium]